jgi:hypothetical protein
MRAPVAVHLDIRPRLTFPAEPHARARRRRWRLPPLAVPALGYWLAMGALTYGFTKLGPHPLDDAEGAARPQASPTLERRHEIEPQLAAEPQRELQAQVETEPPPAPPAPSEPPVAAPAAANNAEPEPANNGKTGRRQGFLGSTQDSSQETSQEKRDEPTAPREQPVARLSFPEFTDSSRPARPEHAADGPRIDSLFDKAEERPSPVPKPDAAPPPTSDPDAPVAVSSCEAAIARYNEQLTIGAARGPADITREAYASILQNGRYLSACSIPERTVFEICAAVKDGRAVGITIVSNPASPALNGCVRKAVARLKFPQNSRLDVTHTRFDAVSR